MWRCSFCRSSASVWQRESPATLKLADMAMRVAAECPDVVRRLILISSAPRFSGEGRERILQQIAAMERGDFMAMARPFLSLFRRRRLNWLGRFALWMRRRRLASGMNDPQFIKRMLEAGLACSDAASERALTMPALAIIGERDQFYSPNDLRGFDRVVFPRETHMLALERPDAVRDAIAAFLAQV